MDTAALKNFATRARTDLRKEVGGRIDVVLASNSLARVESAAAVLALEKAVALDGREVVVERAAYTWFNRIIALRFMDANGYTPSSVVSPGVGKTTGQPEVLAEVKAGTFDLAVVPERTRERIVALLSGTLRSADPQGEAYGLLLEAYCRYWNKAMPFMFEREGDYTELLMPAALLAEGSVRDQAVRALTEEACQEVEVIGWLYQFYISERKDEVFAGFKNNEKAGAAEIPAATQLFTPHWIVRYLVENSLGRLWLLNHPESKLAEQMDYYIKPVDEEVDFLKIDRPEDLKVIDPAVGSGHMLTYAFDLLYAIYDEQGYAPSDIPGLILEHNLYGVEIDPRAGSLAAFALTMKAAARRKLFLKNPVQPHVIVLMPLSFSSEELEFLVTEGGDHRAEEAFWMQFAHADNFGSLIQPDPELADRLGRHLITLDEDGDILRAHLIELAAGVISQAKYLLPRYAVVVANPPYMGKRNMGDTLRGFAVDTYPNSAGDLCTMFLEQGMRIALDGGFAALIVSESWLFNAGFENLRLSLLAVASPVVTACIDKSAFGVRLNTAASILSKGRVASKSIFFRVAADEVATGVPELPTPDTKLHFIDVERFDHVPGGGLVFDMPEILLSLYGKVPTVGESMDLRQGLATTDNKAFVRFWWEVSRIRTCTTCTSRNEANLSGKRWFPYNKGGSPVAWWGNLEHVVDWEEDGRRIKESIVGKYPYLNGNYSYVAKNPEYYFRSAVSWSNIGVGGARFRMIPEGFIFDVSGMSAFSHDDASSLNLLGYLNSPIVRRGLDVLAPTLNYQIGDVGNLPFVDGADDAERVSRLIEIAYASWADEEIHDAFSSSPLLRPSHQSLAASTDAWRAFWGDRDRELELLESGSAGYWNERISVAAGVSAPTPLSESRVQFASPPTRDLVGDFVSYAVGCMFGRYSLDEPGLILADHGSTLQDYLAKVPVPAFMPDKDNVLPIVDGPWFEDDIVEKFRQFLRVAFGEEHFQENLKFVTDALGVKDLRDYFIKAGSKAATSKFYGDHVQRYKKRPIYWLFSSPTGAFNALVYLHRYNPSTVSTVLTDYLREYITKLEANLQHQELVAAGQGGATAKEIAAALKEADRIRKVLVELKDYDHDVLFPLAGKQVALDLDDGVLVNYQKLGAALKDIGLKKGGGDE